MASFNCMYCNLAHATNLFHLQQSSVPQSILQASHFCWVQHLDYTYVCKGNKDKCWVLAEKIVLPEMIQRSAVKSSERMIELTISHFHSHKIQSYLFIFIHSFTVLLTSRRFWLALKALATPRGQWQHQLDHHERR